MSVTVSFVNSPGVATPTPEVHADATTVDVDFDHLFVYSSPDVVVAAYSKNNWLSAVVS